MTKYSLYWQGYDVNGYSKIRLLSPREWEQPPNQCFHWNRWSKPDFRVSILVTTILAALFRGYYARPAILKAEEALRTKLVRLIIFVPRAFCAFFKFKMAPFCIDETEKALGLIIANQPCPVTSPAPPKLCLGPNFSLSICLKFSTPDLKDELISPCLPSSVKCFITSVSDDGGERGKASKSGKYFRMLSTTLWVLSLGRPPTLKTCLRKKE